MQPAIYNHTDNNNYNDPRFAYNDRSPYLRSPTSGQRTAPPPNGPHRGGGGHRSQILIPLLYCDSEGASVEYNYPRDPPPPPPWDNYNDNPTIGMNSVVGTDQWRTSNNNSRLSLVQQPLPPPPAGPRPSTSMEHMRTAHWSTNHPGPAEPPYNFWSENDNNNSNSNRSHSSPTENSNNTALSNRSSILLPRPSLRNSYAGGGGGPEQTTYRSQQQRDHHHNTQRGPHRHASGSSSSALATDDVLTLQDIVESNLDTKTLPRSTLEHILIVQYAKELNDFDLEELIPQVKRLVEKRKKELKDEQERKRLLQKEQDQLEMEQQQIEQQKKKEQENEASWQCTLCFDNPKDCIFLECGHISSCMECAEKLSTINKKCPVCRQRITRIKHIYYS